ncbi:trypsin-like serine protease [Sorangium sp. So ce341]|uniref:trypsin-like serine protease n=1 Tax=Sorangium sp. So ce341 TaxID=3133302 RepID=UPI003F5FE374
MTNGGSSKGWCGVGGLGLAWIRAGAPSALLALATVACSAADPSDGLSDEPLGVHTEEIRSGTPRGGVGAVEIDVGVGAGCTGMLLGTHMVLTAAHCFDGPLGSALAGFVDIKLNYARTETAWSCMTGEPYHGKCPVARRVFVRRLQKGSEVGADMAAIFTETMGDSFRNVDDDDGVRGIYAGGIRRHEEYIFYGRGSSNFEGTDAGTMRFLADYVTYVDASHFVTDAGLSRVCRGDAGGPYFLRFPEATSEWVFGLQSNYDAPAGAVCVEVGEKARGMMFTDNRMGNVNEWRSLEGLPACAHPSLLDYSNWVCP